MIELLTAGGAKAPVGMSYDSFLSWLSSQTGVFTAPPSDLVGRQGTGKYKIPLVSPASFGNLWGSTWGLRCTVDSNVTSSLLHALPSRLVFDENTSEKRTVYYEWVSRGINTVNYASVVRNGFTSTTYTYNYAGGEMPRVIYYDYLKGCMMTTNPNSMSDPVPFTGVLQ